MRKFLLRGTLLILLVQGSALVLPFARQEYPAPKPKYDYLSSFLSRNTKPLGLKEDQALRKLLRQPTIKWAIRAETRHILD